MPQTFIVQSERIRDKLNQLLPSQNRNAIGVDLSGSTQIIPIVDLTEVASGSSLRQDLQTSSSISDTTYSVTNTATTVINTTGYFRFRGMASGAQDAASKTGTISITDGTTTKVLYRFLIEGSLGTFTSNNFDFNVFLKAGESVIVTSTSALLTVNGTARQIATIDGELVNP